MNNALNYYQIIGVPHDVSLENLKSKFRILAHQFHPDKNNNSEESVLRFRQIHEAYQILSDFNKRAMYDRYLRTSSLAQKYSESSSQIQSDTRRAADLRDELVSSLNFILWEVEDILSKQHFDINQKLYTGKSLEQWLQIILDFLDNWILVPAGFPDYFYASRRISNTEKFARVSEALGSQTHVPYVNFRDYFYQLRRRFDQMSNKISKEILETNVDGTQSSILDAMYEFKNLSYYYLGYIHAVLLGERIEFHPYVFGKRHFDNSGKRLEKQ